MVLSGSRTTGRVSKNRSSSSSSRSRGSSSSSKVSDEARQRAQRLSSLSSSSPNSPTYPSSSNQNVNSKISSEARQRAQRLSSLASRRESEKNESILARQRATRHINAQQKELFWKITNAKNAQEALEIRNNAMRKNPNLGTYNVVKKNGKIVSTSGHLGIKKINAPQRSGSPSSKSTSRLPSNSSNSSHSSYNPQTGFGHTPSGLRSSNQKIPKKSKSGIDIVNEKLQGPKRPVLALLPGIPQAHADKGQTTVREQDLPLNIPKTVPGDVIPLVPKDSMNFFEGGKRTLTDYWNVGASASAWVQGKNFESQYTKTDNPSYDPLISDLSSAEKQYQKNLEQYSKANKRLEQYPDVIYDSKVYSEYEKAFENAEKERMELNKVIQKKNSLNRKLEDTDPFIYAKNPDYVKPADTTIGDYFNAVTKGVEDSRAFNVPVGVTLDREIGNANAKTVKKAQNNPFGLGGEVFVEGVITVATAGLGHIPKAIRGTSAYLRGLSNSHKLKSFPFEQTNMNLGNSLGRVGKSSRHVDKIIPSVSKFDETNFNLGSGIVKVPKSGNKITDDLFGIGKGSNPDKPKKPKKDPFSDEMPKDDVIINNGDTQLILKTEKKLLQKPKTTQKTKQSNKSTQSTEQQTVKKSKAQQETEKYFENQAKQQTKNIEKALQNTGLLVKGTSKQKTGSLTGKIHVDKPRSTQRKKQKSKRDTPIPTKHIHDFDTPIPTKLITRLDTPIPTKTPPRTTTTFLPPTPKEKLGFGGIPIGMRGFGSQERKPRGQNKKGRYYEAWNIDVNRVGGYLPGPTLVQGRSSKKVWGGLDKRQQKADEKQLQELKNMFGMPSPKPRKSKGKKSKKKKKTNNILDLPDWWV